MIEVLMIVVLLGGVVIGIAIKPENKTDEKVVAMLHDENAKLRYDVACIKDLNKLLNRDLDESQRANDKLRGLGES